DDGLLLPIDGKLHSLCFRSAPFAGINGEETRGERIAIRCDSVYREGAYSAVSRSTRKRRHFRSAACGFETEQLLRLDAAHTDGAVLLDQRFDCFTFQYDGRIGCDEITWSRTRRGAGLSVL